MMDKPGLDKTVKLQASQWLARQRSNLRTDEDARDFQAWLAKDPAHGGAFEALTAVWDMAGNYPRDMRATPAPAMMSSSRRAVMAGLVAAPVMVGAAFLTQLRQAEARTYVTRVGAQRTIELPDHSRALLDTNSRLDALFDRDTRAVTLEFGRANFAVLPDKDHPFVIKVASCQILADASNFDVRRDGHNTSVMLFSGQLSVKFDGEIHRLTAGERMVIVDKTVTAIDRPRPDAVGAWHSGRTVFEGTQLSEAVAEMNRYSQIGLEIQGRDLGARRISGVYRNGDSVAFAKTVAALLGAQIQQTPNRVFIFASDGRPLVQR